MRLTSILVQPSHLRYLKEAPLATNFLFYSLALFLFLACANEEDTDDTVIASEEQLYDVLISSENPNLAGYQTPTGRIGHYDGFEGRLLIQIPQFLNLYREDVIESSIAEITLEISAESVPINPENIRLYFISKQWSPFATWLSSFSLTDGYNWSAPGGDFLELDFQTPNIEKDGSRKRLVFDITSQVIESIESNTTINGFAVTAVESDLNGDNDMTLITFNHESGTAPRATLSFSKSDIIK